MTKPISVTVTELEVRVDGVNSVVEIGQLAGLAPKLGLDLAIRNVDDAEGNLSLELLFRRAYEENDLSDELAGLTALFALAMGRAGDDVLAAVRTDLINRHFPMDKPVQDVMSIGGGPGHEGHDS